MKNKFILTLIPLLLLPIGGNSQERKSEWEAGAGGSLINMTRTMVSNFHQTKGGDYVFDLEDKHLYGGAEIYVAKSLSKMWYVDLQGTLGFARYFDDGDRKQGYSYMAGPGIQFRPLVNSQWIVPYIRAGINAYHKTFKTKYFGTFDQDVTGEGQWRAEDAWNKGYTVDHNTFFPISVGIGVIGWMGNKVGIRIQGQFLKPVIKDGPNFVEATAGLLFSIGGNDKRKAAADAYVASHLSDYDELYRSRFPKEIVEKEIVKEVPVEKEVIKYVKSEDRLSKLIDNIHFDFDKYTLTPESEATLDEIAEILNEEHDSKFMVSGYTDAKGSRAYNERLSLNRAKAVRDGLVRRGVRENRLVVKGFGKRISITPAYSSDEERRIDRKVLIERIY
jgi:OOP family OmpA-OmpF porin